MSVEARLGAVAPRVLLAVRRYGDDPNTVVVFVSKAPAKLPTVELRHGNVQEHEVCTHLPGDRKDLRGVANRPGVVAKVAQQERHPLRKVPVVVGHDNAAMAVGFVYASHGVGT